MTAAETWHRLREKLTTNPQGLPPFVAESPSHRKALEMLQSAKLKEGVEYGWVGEYAKELWTYYMGIFTRLDGKADDVVRYLGGGTGLFALGVLAKVDAKNAYLALLALPAVCVAVMAVLLATLARKPGIVPPLPSVHRAVGYAEDCEKADDATANFLWQWNIACEDMKLVCLRKACWIELATWCYWMALALLLLPLGAAVMWPPAYPAPTP